LARSAARVQLVEARIRFAIAPALIRLRGRDSASRALRGALFSTLLGRIPAEERDWSARIEAYRRQLHASTAELTWPTLRAVPGLPARGHEIDLDLQRTGQVGQEAGLINIPRLWGLFVMRLVRELAPGSCLELGTGFGVSALYQAAALELNGRGRLVTIDAAESRVRMAMQAAADLELGRVEFRVGRIRDLLDDELRRAQPIDFGYVDANHSEAATLHYFERFLPHLAATAVLAFDDIAWTPEMRRAWSRIVADERVTLAVAIHRIGVCLLTPRSAAKDA
jgi:predicted O-methyltransferase YrrM